MLPNDVFPRSAVPDAFSSHYSAFLEGQYDCVDRIILNAYFPMGCSPGGFRNWWRALTGSDDSLDNTHLMRMAGRFSRRLRGWAKSNGIPVIDCPSGDRKHEIAEEHLPKDPKQSGIFLILVGRAPAPLWEIKRFGRGGIEVRRKHPMPYVNHYYFHIWDKEWGHIAIRMCGHPPFGALVMLNGHEYVAQRAGQEGIRFRKEDNCFTGLDNAPGLQQVADTLRSKGAIGHLAEVCERWLTCCLCFALDSDDQKRTGFRYALSIYQGEYSRNFLFKLGRDLEQVFEGLIDRTRATLDIKTVKTILGCKQRPQRRGKTRWEITVEKPEYGLTVFKIRTGVFTLKLYSKGECVLRCEIVLHNARALKLGNNLMRWPTIVEHLHGILERFLEVLQCVDAPAMDDGTWDALPKPSQVGGRRVAGIQLSNKRLGTLVESVLALATQPNGFTSGELAAQMRQRLQCDEQRYQSRQAAYDLKKLRGKGLVEKVGKSRRYLAPAAGLRTMTALLLLREKVFKPVLSQRSTQGQRPPRTGNPIDLHYHNLRQEMRRLLKTLNIAA
jgi:hypothetical protein